MDAGLEFVAWWLSFLVTIVTAGATFCLDDDWWTPVDGGTLCTRSGCSEEWFTLEDAEQPMFFFFIVTEAARAAVCDVDDWGAHAD